MSLSHVVFDFGAVLAWPPSSSACARLSQISGIPRDILLGRYYAERAAYDKDEIAPSDYWRGIARGYPAESDENLLSRLAEADVQAWSEPNHATVGWLPVLKRAGYSLGLLSNMPGPFWDTLVSRTEWLHHFDHCLISGKVRLSKPDPAIFSLLVRTLGCDPGDILFLDDSPKNVAAATAYGVRAELYNVFHGGLAAIADRHRLPPPEEPIPDDDRLNDDACAPHAHA
jgi:putative hydrolase of the HAD superfamily